MSERNKKIVIGGSIILLLLLFLKHKKKTIPSVKEEIKPKETKIAEKTETKMDLSDVPEECLEGFELDGIKYAIKDNKFVKS